MRVPVHKEDKLVKESRPGLEIYLWVHTTRIPGLLPSWLQTGHNVFEVDGVKSVEAEKEKLCALQRLAKDWSSYDHEIHVDGSATNSTAIGWRHVAHC